MFNGGNEIMIVQKRFNNGIELIMEKIPYARSVAFGIWVKAGSIYENAENNGISHFIEHMLFKGTKKRSAKDIAGEIDKIGGQINAFTGKESTCYYVKVLDTHINKAADVLMDMLFHSVFDEGEIKKEKTVVCEEVNMYDDSPEDTVHDMISNLIFDGHPLGRPIIGNHDTILNYSRDSILDYLSKNYALDQIVISVAGNFDEWELIKMLKEKMAGPLGKREKEVPQIPSYESSFKVKNKEIEQAHICIGTKGVPLDHKNYYTLSILSNIMGGSMSSRLFQKIREERGLAYSVYSYTTSYVQDGVFAVYAGVNPSHLEEAVKLMIEEINLLRQKGVTDEELNMAKEQLKGSYILNLDSVSSRMASIGKSQLLLGKVYTPDEVIQNINRVTMENVNEVIQRVTDINQYSGAVVNREDVKLRELIKG